MVSLLLQLYLLQLELLPTVVAALGRPLVTAVPVRPDQDPPHLARHLQYQAPQQVPDLRQAQAPARPRARLKAARLYVAGLFFWVRPVQGGRQQGQRHVLVPAVRAAHLVVSQVRLLPGRLEGVLDGSAVPGHAHQGL